MTGRRQGILDSGKTGITGAPAQEEGWDYDPAGNWNAYDQSVSGSPSVSRTRAHNAVNEIVSFDGSGAPVAYDGAGNMTLVPTGYAGAPTATLTWDAWNRLVRVRDSAAGYDIAYQYDGLTRRTRQVVIAGSFDNLDFYWNLDWKCVETRLSGTTTMKAQYLYGAQGRNDTVLRDAGGTRIYVSTDAMLSATATYDDTGAALQRYGYTAFGDAARLTSTFAAWSGTDTVNWRSLFHGEYADNATGWYNYGYRYYFPALGRWASRDYINSDYEVLPVINIMFDDFKSFSQQKPNVIHYDHHAAVPNKRPPIRRVLFDNKPHSGYINNGSPSSDAEFLPEGPNVYIFVGNSPFVNFDQLGNSAVGVVGGCVATDAAIPDPSDALWPKWVIYGVAIAGAGLIDICFSRRKEVCKVKCQVVQIGNENNVIGTTFGVGSGPNRNAACAAAEAVARSSTALGTRTKHCYPIT